MDVVDILVAMRGVEAFVADANRASGAVTKVGTSTEDTGKKASMGWKGIAKWAATGTVIYGATRFLKSATSATEDLAKSTLTLQRTTGMDTETASEWAALTKERGISTKQLQTSLVKLSKTMESSRTGTAKEADTIKGLRQQIDAVEQAGGKKAPAALDRLSKSIARAQLAGDKSRATLSQLGVSFRDVAKGNTEAVLSRVADGLQRIQDPARRAALMQTLFGKSGQALLPILMKGSAGVRKLLDEQKAAGNYIGGKGIDNAKKLIEQQRNLDRQYSGLKVQLGTALMPVMIQFGKVLNGLFKVLSPLTRNTKLFTAAILAITAAFIAWKVVLIATTIQQLELDAAMLPIIGTIAAVVAVVALLAVGFYELYKHVGWFRDAVKATWAWIKANWPLLVAILLGPIGIAIGLIVKHFDMIKAAAGAVVAWLKANWQYIVAAILIGPMGVAAVAIIKHFGAIKAFVLGVVQSIRQAIENLVQYVESLPGKVGGVLTNLPGIKQAGGIVHSVGGLFHRQLGGPVPAGGVALVGEHGPELIRARTGLSVQPVALTAELAGGGGDHRPLVIEIPVVVDGRELTRAVARVTADKLARR